MLPITARFQEAMAYAAELHANQARKGTEIPYLSHLLAVASLAMEYGADEDEAIAALLHDAVEDQGGAPTCEAIRERFGERVVEIVIACSDTDETPKPPWRKRKEDHLAHLRQADNSILLISACDKLHNIRSIVSDYRILGDDLFNRFNAGKEGTLWYYRALANVFLELGPSRPAEELDRVVSTLEKMTGERN